MEVDLLDIDLIEDEKARVRYICGECGRLALNAQSLNCSTRYHPIGLTLYCKNCAILKKKINKCPINKHLNPQFHEALIPQTEIERTVDFICPYSNKYKNIKQRGPVINNDNVVANVDDTYRCGHGKEGQNEFDDEKKQENGCNCNWKGKYIELKNHLKRCKYKPITTAKVANIMIATNNERHVEYTNSVIKQLKFERKQIIASQNKKFAQLQKNIMFVAEENKALKSRINELRKCIKQQSTKKTKLDKNSILISSIICCILAIVIYVVLYQQNTIWNHSNETREIIHNKYNDTKEMIQSIMERIEVIDNQQYVLFKQVTTLKSMNNQAENQADNQEDKNSKDEENQEIESSLINEERIKSIPLIIDSHNGHYSNYKPENILSASYDAYCSKPGVVSGDWIMFSINDESDLDNMYYYYPIKMQLRTCDNNWSVKQFILTMGSSSTNEWIQMHKEIFIAQQMDETEIQEFNLSVNDMELERNKIKEQRYNQFKLKLIDNHGDPHSICITEFKIFAVKLK